MLSLVLRRAASSAASAPSAAAAPAAAGVTQAASEQLLGRLERLLGSSKVSTGLSQRQLHAGDESYHARMPADIVTFPTSTEEVAAIVKLCHEHRIPMIPWGTGTGLEGGVSATRGGVAINLQKMDKVVSVNADDFDCTVEPGVTRKALNAFLRDTGLWFPVDPGADASICGMCATSASGTNAVRYGTMRENVLNLEVVMPDGSIVHTNGPKGRSRKTSAGYNLTNLMVGSEGTLGIITKATVRLHGQPAAVASAVCAFPTVHAASVTAMQILQANIPIARMELLDATMIDAVNKYAKLDHPIQPHLFLEFHGFSASSVNEQVELAEDIAKMNEGAGFQFAVEPEVRRKLWEARHNAWYAGLALRPGCRGYATDVCVPTSRLADIIDYTTELIKKLQLIAPIAGHVGDGNFHCLIPLDFSNPAEVAKVKDFSTAIARVAIDMHGTCTGEHGIGLGKRMLLVEEIGAEGIAVMRAIKQALDPYNLMNPDKVLTASA